MSSIAVDDYQPIAVHMGIFNELRLTVKSILLQVLSDDQILHFYKIALYTAFANLMDDEVAAASFCFLDLLNIDSSRLKIEILAGRSIFLHHPDINKLYQMESGSLAGTVIGPSSYNTSSTLSNSLPTSSTASPSRPSVLSYLADLFLSFPIDAGSLRRQYSNDEHAPSDLATKSQSLLVALRSVRLVSFELRNMFSSIFFHFLPGFWKKLARMSKKM